MECILACVIILSGLIQGGYFPSIFLMAGILLAFCRGAVSCRRVSIPEWVMWALSGWYLIASLVNGYNAASIAQACLPGVCACFLGCYLSLSNEKRDRMLSLIIAGSCIYAVIGIIAYSGVIQIASAVTSRRLQFPFQYANAAGAWYAAVVLVCQDKPERRLKSARVPLMTALFLTRSIGALTVYGLLQCCRLVLLRGDKDAWKNTVLIHAVPAVFSAAFYYISGVPAVMLLAALCFVGAFFDRIAVSAIRLKLHWLTVVCGGVFGFMIAGSQRLASGIGTFAERLSQIADGAALIWIHPVFGVGAGNWEYFYPYHQSSQYVSTVVHCGFIQIGVDAGLIAMGLAALFVVLTKFWKQNKREIVLGALLLLLHSLGDFNFQFFPICALTLALLCYGEMPEKFGGVKFLEILFSALFGILFCAALYSEQMSKQLVHRMNGKRWDSVVTYYEKNKALFGGSREVKEYYIQALSALGENERVLAETAGPADVPVIVLRAQAFYNLGETDAACALLLAELEQRPFQVSFFEQAAQCLTLWNAGDSYIETYNRIVEAANRRHTFLSVLQGTQEISQIK